MRAEVDVWREFVDPRPGGYIYRKNADGRWQWWHYDPSFGAGGWLDCDEPAEDLLLTSEEHDAQKRAALERERREFTLWSRHPWEPKPQRGAGWEGK